MSAMDDLFQRWTTPPMSYILLAVIIIVACFILFKKFYKKKPEHYNNISAEYVVKELNFKPIFNEFSRKCKNGKLYHNLGNVKVQRVVMCNATLILNEQTKTYNDNKDAKFTLFKTGSFWSEIPLFSLFFKPSYYLIDNQSNIMEKHKESDTWVISPNVFLHKFVDVWQCSKTGEKLLTELIYKFTYEKNLEIEMNYGMRVVWYNDIYAYNLGGMHLKYDLEKRKFETAVESETGVKKQ